MCPLSFFCCSMCESCWIAKEMRSVVFSSYYSCTSTCELQFLNNIFQVNGLKMVDEPMEEGEADSCQVSTGVNLLSYIFRI